MHFVKFTKFIFLPRKSNYWSSAKIKNNDEKFLRSSKYIRNNSSPLAESIGHPIL